MRERDETLAREHSRGLLPHPRPRLWGRSHLGADVQQRLLLRVDAHRLRLLQASHEDVHNLRLRPHLQARRAPKRDDVETRKLKGGVHQSLIPAHTPGGAGSECREENATLAL